MRDKEFVKERIPHREPFLLVDGVISMTDSEILAFRDLLQNDPVFEGHFPGYPIYPGVLILEGLAQTAGILLLKPNETPLFAGIERARFKTIVRPPCRIEYSVKLINSRMNVAKLETSAYVEGKLAAKAILLVSSI